VAKDRRKIVFWRRAKPLRKYDIVVVRPASLPKGKRFETLDDVRAESERSEKLLTQAGKVSSPFAATMSECRQGDHCCAKPYCPICARTFRRWLIGELLRITQGKSAKMMTVLLKAAERTQIESLDPRSYSHLLRKRLQRAGFDKTPIIGGYEMVYRAREKCWILHINLVIIGGDKSAFDKFRGSFSNSEFDRPVVMLELKDRPEQLSYVLKFTTYHRPNQKDARPLNRREHNELVKWMAQFEFPDCLFLFNARRQGSKIVTAF
jgi:hypothetical protein